MNLLAEGIELAKDLAVDVVQQGGLALTRKQVQVRCYSQDRNALVSVRVHLFMHSPHRSLLLLHTHTHTNHTQQPQGQRGFWYLDLANINFASQQKFHHPSTLLKLAIFLR